MSEKAPIVVLASGSGTLLQALLDAAADPQVPFAVAAVVCDRDGIAALDRARGVGIPTAVVAPSDFDDRQTWDQAMAKAVEVFSPSLVVAAGFMRLLGAAYLDVFGTRTINSHPALMPAFPGAHAVRDALAYGVKVTGTTVMLLDSGVDTGPVVAQRAVEVHADDDESSLHERIKVVERELLVDVVTAMVRDGWTVQERTVRLGTGNAPRNG